MRIIYVTNKQKRLLSIHGLHLSPQQTNKSKNLSDNLNCGTRRTHKNYDCYYKSWQLRLHYIHTDNCAVYILKAITLVYNQPSKQTLSNCIDLPNPAFISSEIWRLEETRVSVKKHPTSGNKRPIWQIFLHTQNIGVHYRMRPAWSPLSSILFRIRRPQQS